MVKDVKGVYEKNDEILELGKKRVTTLQEVAETWECSTENVAKYLHRLQEQKKYAYLVDGNGRFRILKDYE
jgi:MarR-like DNA-binding transcriptional regulator SgrR of sgrS sRNA